MVKMAEWHRCRRWRRRALQCPFVGIEEHEDDRDDPEEPAPKAPKPIVLGPPGKSKTGAEAGDTRYETRGPGVVEQAEAVVRGVPLPVPLMEPFRGPPAEPDPVRPRAKTRKQPSPDLPPPPPIRGAPGLDPSLYKETTTVVKEAASHALQKVYRAEELARPIPPRVPLRPRPRLDPGPTAPAVVTAMMAEEAVAQEFANAPPPAGSGFQLKRKAIGMGIAAGAGAGVAALAGGANFLFNANARMNALLQGGGPF